MRGEQIQIILDEDLMYEVERIQEARMRASGDYIPLAGVIVNLLREALANRKATAPGHMSSVQARVWRKIRDTPVPVRAVVMNGGVLPKRATAGSAGYDLYASEDAELPAQVPVAVGVGLRVEIPPGYEMQIRPRSGLAIKQGITVLNSPGTIDSDYRGEVKVILFNTGMVPQRVLKGDRIAQAVIAPVWTVDWIEAGSVSDTERGEGGFGSTGGSKGESDV